MAGLKIKQYIPLAVFALFMGCSLSAITAQGELEPQSPSVSDGVSNSKPSPGKPTSYFIEIWMKGESTTSRFVQQSIGAYANGVEFQIRHLPDKDAFVSFQSDRVSDGSHRIYGFSDITGNHFDIRRYISAPNLKTPENSKTVQVYYWIKKGPYLFSRENLVITVPEHLFDADIHQNVARFTVTSYPDFKDTRPDLITFDGFKPK